jgi:hypothetical protein
MQIGRIPAGAQSPLLEQLQNRSPESQQAALDARMGGGPDRDIALMLAQHLLSKSPDIARTLQVPPYQMGQLPDMSAFRAM